MWPFKRKTTVRKSPLAVNQHCPYCESTNTARVAYNSNEQADYIKSWRGQRYVTCRCLACGRDFYADEPQGGIANQAQKDEAIVDDESELQAAEDELRRQIEEDDDRMLR
jgi:hypothetical protein